MPGAGWNDWRRYPQSGPIPTTDGLATSKQRGAMADTWWSRRFVDVLESYGLGGRMERGRRYARKGQVVSLAVDAPTIAAQVQGSRPTPYRVTISLAEPTAAQWDAVAAAMAAKVGFVARLLDGEVPPELEAVFEAAGVPLLPRRWPELHASCNCPDDETPCKHIAAVLYVFADRLDTDPWLLLQWRGRSRDEVLEPLLGAPGASAGGGVGDAAPIAAWWPFVTGRVPPVGDGAPSATAALADRDDPAAVLDQLAELDVRVAGTPLVDVVRPVYAVLADGAETEIDGDLADPALG